MVVSKRDGLPQLRSEVSVHTFLHLISISQVLVRMRMVERRGIDRKTERSFIEVSY